MLFPESEDVRTSALEFYQSSAVWFEFCVEFCFSVVSFVKESIKYSVAPE